MCDRCEYFMALNKPLLVHVVQHFDTAREHPVLYEAWARSFKAIASKPHNVIAAHNMYDLRYTEYYTGITPLYLCVLDAQQRRPPSPPFPRWVKGLQLVAEVPWP